jgi:hypothetical protein
MEHVSLMLPNTPENQALCRQIRDAHKKRSQPLTIRFDEGLTHIILEAPWLYVPDQRALGKDVQIRGQVRKMGAHYEIHPRVKGKTINLHLDSELVAELEQIRAHVASRTQHEVILEMFIRGMRAYQAEQEEQDGKKSE